MEERLLQDPQPDDDTLQQQQHHQQQQQQQQEQEQPQPQRVIIDDDDSRDESGITGGITGGGGGGGSGSAGVTYIKANVGESGSSGNNNNNNNNNNNSSSSSSSSGSSSGSSGGGIGEEHGREYDEEEGFGGKRGGGLNGRRGGDAGGLDALKERLEVVVDRVYLLAEDVLDNYTDKGTLSNVATFVLFLVGVICKAVSDNAAWAEVLFQTALFGFAGGITNWLAVKMLFDRIPGLVGSGVIPAKFREIREAVKTTIMKTFFDTVFLQRYIHGKTESMKQSINVEEKLTALLQSPRLDDALDRELAALATRPEGMMFAMMGIAPAQLKPIIKPFILGMGKALAPGLVEQFDPLELISIDKVRAEIDELMTVKLQELTPEVVKRLMEEVIRQHLGWLIVWGNVFGALIGLIYAVITVA